MPLLFVISFAIRQQRIRHRMKERMEEQMLHIVTLDNNDIHWAKKGKEIWVNGKLFDIKSFEQINGKTIFCGLYDEEETSLNKTFSENWKKDLSGQTSLLSQLFQCFQNLFFKQVAEISTLTDKKSCLFPISTVRLVTQFKTILTPPPQL